MPYEIERQYLVKYMPDNYKAVYHYRQGYLNISKDATVRVRTDGFKGYITIKGEQINFSRLEYEYIIPIKEANELLDNLCIKPLIDKHRHIIDYEGMEWVIDIFAKENEGLIMAEIELEYKEQVFKKPDWVGKEVSNDSRYCNSRLVINPFKSW